jgi:hypothetical protein
MYASLLAALALSPAAHAKSAKAGWSNLSIQLIDLDPNDQITPWISLGNSSTKTTYDIFKGAARLSGVFRLPEYCKRLEWGAAARAGARHLCAAVGRAGSGWRAGQEA